MVSRWHQILQLKDNVSLRTNLLLRQTEEFKMNLLSCVNEIVRDVSKCLQTAGHDQPCVGRLQEMLKKVDRVTEVIANLNSMFFDKMESLNEEEVEQKRGREDGSSQSKGHSRQATDGSENDGEPRHTVRHTEAAASQVSGGSVSPQVEVLQPQKPSLPGPQPSQTSSVVAAACGQASMQAVPLVLVSSQQSSASGMIAATLSMHAVEVKTARASLVSQVAGGLQPLCSTDFITPEQSSLSRTDYSRDLLAGDGDRPGTVTSTLVSGPSMRTGVPMIAGKGVGQAALHGQEVLVQTSNPAQHDDPMDSGQSVSHLPSSVVKPPVVNEKPLRKDRLPVVEGGTHVFITHVDNPWSFYVVRNQKSLKDLAEKIGQHVWQTWDVVSDVGIGSLCLAQFTDGLFYRAQVQQVDSNGSAVVFFVDYGNVANTKLDKLIVLPQHFRELPAQAIHCCLSEVMSSSKTKVWNQRAIDEFEELVSGGEGVLCLPLPLSRVYPHLPTLVKLHLICEKKGCRPESEYSVKDLLINNGLACSIFNQALLVLLEKLYGGSDSASLPELPGVSPAISETHALGDFDQQMLSPAQLNSIMQKTKRHSAMLKILKGCEVISSGDALASNNEGKLPVADNASRENADKALRLAEDSPRDGAEVATDRVDDAAEDSNTASSTQANDKSKDYTNLLHALTGSSLHSCFRAMVAAVVSPTDFYVHRVCQQTGQLLDSMNKELQQQFSRMRGPGMRLRFSRKLEAKCGTLCCAQFSDEAFYRGFIRRIEESTDDSTKLVEVFFIDYGETEWLPRSQVYPLAQHLHSVPPQALWCSLAFVRPLDGAGGGPEGKGWRWDQRAVQEFVRLVADEQILEVFTPGKLPEPRKRADVLQTSPLEVLMDEKAGDVNINHDLIVRGFAALHYTPSTPVCPEDEEENGEENEDTMSIGSDSMWQDMEQDAKSLRNTYKVDIADAGVIATGVKAYGRQQGVCRFYSHPSGCHKGNRCNYLHMEPSHQGVSGNLTKVSIFNDNQNEILPPVGAVVTVEVTCVISPSFFYISLPWGPYSVEEVTRQTQDVKDYLSGETLTSLNDAMAKFYKDKRLDSDYSLYAYGEAVAAFSEKSGLWLRAKVIDIEPDEEAVRVMYVDFGDMEWVKEHSLRQLDMQFLPLPPQAVECGLVGLQPPPPHGKAWPQEYCSEFFKLVNGKSLVAHVKERLLSGRLLVELYDTTHSTEDINLRMTLIQRGLAILDPSTEVKNTDCKGVMEEAIAKDGDVIYGPG